MNWVVPRWVLFTVVSMVVVLGSAAVWVLWPDSSAPADSSESAPWSASPLVLTSRGLGAVRIGMVAADAVKAAGVPIVDPSSPACPLYRTEQGRPMWRADATGKVELIMVGGFGNADGKPQLAISTREGIRIGDPVEKVKAAYGDRAVATTNQFNSTLITVDSGDGTSLRFDLGEGGVVAEMQAGQTKMIKYLELCG